MHWMLFGLALVWIIVVALCLIVHQLMAQNGRLRRRLELLEQSHGESAPEADEDHRLASELPTGSIAPDFELPDLTGRHRRLSEWRGQRVLLIFFDPRCGFCREMLPALAALPSDTAVGRPTVILISTGEVAENQELVEKFGLDCAVLLPEDEQTVRAYQIGGTPMGYLVDESGAIASDVAVGGPALLLLAGEPPVIPAIDEGRAGPARGNGHGTPVIDPSLAKSHLIRDGLKRGTPAPVFRLPRLDGGELSLLQYRGRQLLVVFSDPECGPCNDLLPELELRYRQSKDLEIVMISRGDPNANRAKVTEHGLTFLIALQRHWEVSRDYGMFGTTIGYLIDEWDVTGADAILTLVSLTTVQGDGPVLEALARQDFCSSIWQAGRCVARKRTIRRALRYSSLVATVRSVPSAPYPMKKYRIYDYTQDLRL